MDLGITFTFTKTPDGTTIIGEFAPRPKGVMRLLFPLLRPMIRRDMATQHARFVALFESEAQRDRPSLEVPPRPGMVTRVESDVHD